MMLALALTALTGPAFAHTGVEHAGSFASGFAHPWTGVDHVAAMLAVGLWAALRGGDARWLWPVAFVGMMVAGGILAMTGVPGPLVEPGIVVSVIALGLLIFLAVQVPLGAGAILVGAFALLHGYAHGAELPSTTVGVSYVAGFSLATASLHILGIALAIMSASVAGSRFVRGAGAAVVLTGLALAIF